MNFWLQKFRVVGASRGYVGRALAARFVIGFHRNNPEAEHEHAYASVGMSGVFCGVSKHH